MTPRDLPTNQCLSSGSRRRIGGSDRSTTTNDNGNNNNEMTLGSTLSWILLLIAATCCCCRSVGSNPPFFVVVEGFVVPNQGNPRTGTSSSTTSSTYTTRIFAGTPRIDEWQVLKSGAVKGTITNHPTLPNGYEITTSPLSVTATPSDNAVVVTASGSKYKLLKGLKGPNPPKQQQQQQQQPNKNKQPPAAAAAKNKNTKEQATTKPPKRSTMSIFGLPREETSSAKSKAKAPTKSQPKQQQQQQPPKKKQPAVAATTNYDLNGKVVGNAKTGVEYLLVGKLIRSSSKRSQIYYAYESDSDGRPSNNNKLTVKLSASRERLSRENTNYDRVASKGRVAFSLQGSGSCFVKKVGFVPDTDASGATRGIPRGSSALVLESGDSNLRAFLRDNGKKGLAGSDLRRAAVSVCRCVEAMHSSGLVWTDLKAENFVLVADGDVKGIDLESAVPVRSAPEDYSPEACPPEFAIAEKRGVGYDFECLKNYDTWSLGMLLFELSVGTNYFRGKSEDAILNALANGSIVGGNDEDGDDGGSAATVAGLGVIGDERLRDLVSQCLSINPKKRPSIGQVLLHPYFLTTGIGPLTF